MAPKARASERRAERLLGDLLCSQGWDLRKPPKGDLLVQHEYKDYPHLLAMFKGTSKSGTGAGVPEAILVDKRTIEPLLVIETKAKATEIDQAVKEATLDYGTACIKAGSNPLALGLAGVDDDQHEVRLLKWIRTKWEYVTYEGAPVKWVPNREDLDRILPMRGPKELRPSVPPPEVLASKADELNRLLRESGIKDEFRPAVVGAIMLALWQSKGRIRREKDFILKDVNDACEQAFKNAGKIKLAESLHVDEANEDLAINAKQMASILERLNVTVLTAEHDYLGQLYETFFRYTGGNTIGQYFTPRHITSMMADLCEVNYADIILDPACGTGGFLIAAMNRIQAEGHITRKQAVNFVRKKLIGYEKEPITAALCVANMILRGDGSSGVHQDDCFTVNGFPSNATVALMNPPFPHKKTDVPPERFTERALDGIQTRGKLAVILPTSLLVKNDKETWRKNILKNNTLLAVCQLPDELFQPYASSTTSVVMLEKGTPHRENRKSAFVRIQNDGYTLKKGTRVVRKFNGSEVPRAIDAIMNKKEISGFSGISSIKPGDEWGVGAYIPSNKYSNLEIQRNVDILIRRLASFYARYAPEIIIQREAIKNKETTVFPYRDLLSQQRKDNFEALPSSRGAIGSVFDIYYGMKELHSREGIPLGKSLIISPTEEYNGCYGWLDFQPVLKPPFITVAQTGSIGEAFVQLEPCAVNDDCLILLLRIRMNLDTRSHERGHPGAQRRRNPPQITNCPA